MLLFAYKSLFPSFALATQRQCNINDLENLALIKKNPAGKYSLTAFGDEVLAQRGDLRGSFLATICARFDLPWHGWIAAAYVDAQRECFVIHDYSSTCGLYPEQLALAHHTGNNTNNAEADSLVAPRASDDARHCSELHTAIREYLTAASEKRKPDTTMFRAICFTNMQKNIQKSTRHALTPALAATFLQEKNWEKVVTMGVAWAYQDHVAVEIKTDTYKTTLPNTEWLRVQNLSSPEDFQHVTVNKNSLALTEYTREGT